MTLCLSKSCRKMSFLMGEPRLHIGVMWSISKLDLKGLILVRQSGYKSEWWGSHTLTYFLIKSYFWRSKSFQLGRNYPTGSMNTQNLTFSNVHQCVYIDDIFPTVPVSHQTDIVCKSYWPFKFGKHWKKRDDVAVNTTNIRMMSACWHGNTRGCHMLGIIWWFYA